MYIFRPMIKEDTAAVYKLEKKLYHDPWPEKSICIEPFENEKAFAFVTEKETEILGYIMGWYIDPEIHLSNIAVKKNYQRQGIGSFLLTNLFSTFPDYEICFLEVRASNHSARKLYQKFGFDEIYNRKFYYDDGETAIIMSKYK